jgi:hydrogenase maturation factor HypE
MIMDEIIRRITEGQDGGTPQTLVYAYIIIYELIQRTLDVKFHRILTVCKDSGLNINFDKCMVMK